MNVFRYLTGKIKHTERYTSQEWGRVRDETELDLGPEVLLPETHCVLLGVGSPPGIPLWNEVLDDYLEGPFCPLQDMAICLQD